MSRRLHLAVAVATLSTAVPAAAVTINFDTLPNGSAVTNLTPIGSQYASQGVTFSAVNGSDTSVLPAATDYTAANTGIFANPYSQGLYLANSPRGELFVFDPVFQLTPRYDIVRLTFNGTANNISLGLNNFSLVGTTTFNAYGANGALLQTFTTNAGTGWALRSLAVNNVARLDLVTNNTNGLNNYFGIDNVNFTLNAAPGAVPEPATWALMILGFGAVGATMRRRARSVALAHA